MTHFADLSLPHAIALLVFVPLVGAMLVHTVAALVRDIISHLNERF